VTVDFQGHAQARVPFLNRDLYGLRSAVQAGTLGGPQVDQARVYLVPSGHRLTRDLVYAREAGRTLAFDLITPAAPLGLRAWCWSFRATTRTGWATRPCRSAPTRCSTPQRRKVGPWPWRTTRSPHPTRESTPCHPPRCGPKPHCAAVRKEAVARGANGRIVPVGFSRGSGMALLLATTAGRSEFEGYGEAADVESSVQGAVVLSGRFTYLDLLPTDPDDPAVRKGLGNRRTAARHLAASRRARLRHAGARRAALPLHQSGGIAGGAAPDVRVASDPDRMELTLRFQPESDGRGHKVPLDPAVLTALFRFLSDQLHPGAAPDGATSAAPAVARPSSL
jgi:hypothetical protein